MGRARRGRVRAQTRLKISDPVPRPGRLSTRGEQPGVMPRTFWSFTVFDALLAIGRSSVLVTALVTASRVTEGYNVQRGETTVYGESLVYQGFGGFALSAESRKNAGANHL